MEHNNHSIHPNWKLISNHAPLTVNISIFKEYVQTRRKMPAINNEEEEYFLNKLINTINKINAENIQSKEVLKSVIQLFTYYIDKT